MVDIARHNKGANSLANRHFHGIIIDNKDPEKLQRVKVRIPALHKELKDEELPWVFPATSNVQGNASGAVGSVGPIPSIGSKVNMEYPDDSMYHGMYYGTVTTKDTKIGDFTGSSGYGSDYPHVEGNVDESGNLEATNTKRDTKESTHVSGTGHEIDGAGNVRVRINGGAETGNKDREVKFPTGSTLEITGDCTLKVSKGVTIQCQGPVKINSSGDVELTTTSGIMSLTATVIRFHAAKITSNVEIQLAKGLNPPPVPQKPSTVTPRSRPSVPSPANKQDY